MYLPPIKNKIAEDQSPLRRKILTLNNHNSQKDINHHFAKQRCYTETKGNYIGQKLINYIGFDRVKILKSYAQICQQNLRKFNEQKNQLKSMKASRCYIDSKIKSSKLILSPRGNSIKIHLKSANHDSARDKERMIDKQMKFFDKKQRLKTQVMAIKQEQTKKKVKQELNKKESNCINLKKYSQMSIRQIIEKDLVFQSKRKFQSNHRKSSHRLQGW